MRFESHPAIIPHVTAIGAFQTNPHRNLMPRTHAQILTPNTIFPRSVYGFSYLGAGWKAVKHNPLRSPWASGAEGPRACKNSGLRPRACRALRTKGLGHLGPCGLRPESLGPYPLALAPWGRGSLDPWGPKGQACWAGTQDMFGRHVISNNYKKSLCFGLFVYVIHDIGFSS